MTPRCVRCKRLMYSDYGATDAIVAVYPWHDKKGTRSPWATDWCALNRDWGWQSAWEPTMCRRCNTEHDHRESPKPRHWLRRLLRKP